MKLKYQLVGLDCAACAKKIEDRVNKLDNVKECSLNFTTSKMIIETNDDDHEIINIIKKIVTDLEPDVEVIELVHHHNHEHQNSSKENTKIIGGISYSIKGLDCASCALKVEDKLNQLDIIDSAVINFSTEILQVKLVEEIDSNSLVDTLQKAIDQVEDGVVVSVKDKIKIHEKPKLFNFKENIYLIIGIITFIIGIVFEDKNFAVIIFLTSYVLIGYKVLLKAIKNIMRREVFDENFLMCIATIGAICIGDFEEAVAVMLFYSIGEIFQSYAVNKTRTSISSLMDIKSDYANLLVDGNISKVAPEAVLVDDLIVVKVGEKVPLDGTVVEGNSMIDTSSLTGESLPREVNQNDEVLAGVVNLTSVITLNVTRQYEDSTVAKILELIENAASKKAPIEKFITRFARVYTPTVVVLALLLAIVPLFIFKDAVFSEWLYRALTFLVVSCPCALVISIPLGLYAGLGKASKVGVLIKGGNYLELLKDINTVVFDKTGTLTEGSFEVVEVNGNNELLMYGAYGEYLSNHPIAKSIVKKYSEVIDQSKIKDFKEMAGKGIEVYINDKHVFLGNKSYLESLNFKVTEPATIGTFVHIVIDNKYVGNIVVADKIKDTTISGIKRLKQNGITNTVMLTGDHHVVANEIAKKVGIDTVYSELLPQDKVTKVEDLMKNSDCKLAFVGDGINDAPVLARADIGIAMGLAGSDAAIEAADIVLMKDDIEAINEAITISKKTNTILKQNVTFTLVIKIGVLILTMFGLTNMWMGVFADVGVTLIAILNSMRILNGK